MGALTDSTDGVTGSQAWTFSAPDQYFDYLADGETVTLTYTVEVDDHHGGIVTQTVAVTVNGTNDAPEVAADVSGTNGLHAITEQDGVTGSTGLHSASGSLAFRDVDLSDTHTLRQFQAGLRLARFERRSADPDCHAGRRADGGECAHPDTARQHRHRPRLRRFPLQRRR